MKFHNVVHLMDLYKHIHHHMLLLMNVQILLIGVNDEIFDDFEYVLYMIHC